MKNNIVVPTVTQLGREGAKNTAPGQLFIVQLADGSYVIIDSGLNNQHDEQALWEFLLEHNPSREEKPRITWMFTHAHCDHMHLALRFLENNFENIILERVCYNFPDFKKVKVVHENEGSIADCIRSSEKIDELLQSKYQNAQKIIIHTGDVLELFECKVEILYTHEDFPVAEFPYVNHTSAAWRMNFSTGKSFLVPGDCDTSLCEQMANKYGEYLKSDVFHTTHHGFNGGQLDFYRYAAPTVCFWTVDTARFENDVRCLGTKSEYYSYNKWVRENCSRHYPADITVTVDMSTLEIL